MPPLPNVPSVIKTRVFFTIGSKFDQGLRFYYLYTGSAPTTGDLTAFANSLKTEADSVLPAVMNPEVTLTGYSMEDLTSSTSAAISVADSTAGTRAGGFLSAQTAFVTSYEISRRYRGGHPRSYWPLGGPGDLLNDDTWTTAAQSAFITAIDSVINSLVGAVEGSTTITNHVSVSYYNGFTSVENPITHRYRNVPTLRAAPVIDLVNSVVGRPYIGSIRRRRPKTS